MLHDLISSKTRHTLLTTFFGSPDREYYTRQLAKSQKMSVGNLHRELKRLLAAGVLCVRQVGNIKLYSLNKHNSVYDELKNLISKTYGVIGLVRDAISKVEGISVSFIYGSFAKGNERHDSDIDIFLVGDSIDENALVLCISALERKLSKEINYTRYTRSEYIKEKKKKNSFILEVIRGQKIFIEGSESDL